jgi:predicted PurR-regulated permease PerM
MVDPRRDLTRVTLGVLLIGALIAASFWILRPFLPATIWATMIVVSTWPLMRRVQALLWGKRWMAVIVMSIVLLLVFVVPLSLAISTILANTDRFIDWAQSIASFSMPAMPSWLADIPLVGSSAVGLWERLSAIDVKDIAAKITPYAGTATRWFISQVGNLGFMFLQFLLTVAFAAIMYAKGEAAAGAVIQFGHRLAGERGETAVLLAGHAIRGVAMGVVVTAIVQSALGGIGLAICGVPFAAILTAVMFMLCIAQLGPAPVLVPAIIWMYWSGDTGWATVLVGFTLFVGTLDNFLRPILIKRSADLPLLLIFIGVIGGLMAFGLIGIFVGPVVLAVGYTLLQAWVGEDPAPPSAA